MKLGFVVWERSVSRYLRRVRCRGDPSKPRSAFLHNHLKVIVALDFFTAPMVTSRLLYCLFVIEHGLCRILQFFSARPHPTAKWVAQRLLDHMIRLGKWHI